MTLFHRFSDSFEITSCKSKSWLSDMEVGSMVVSKDEPDGLFGQAILNVIDIFF